MCKKIMALLILSISSTLMMACSHVAGNVVPDQGPTMERIYDDLGEALVNEVNDETPTPVFTEPAPSAVKPGSELPLPVKGISPPF